MFRSVVQEAAMENDMDAVLALAVERGLLNDILFNDERKKMKKEGSQDQRNQQSLEKKQKSNDGGGGSNGKDNKKIKTFEQLECVTVVMKVDFHCDGCRRRIFDAARSFRGTEYVKIEEDKNKLTVTGRVDPMKLHEKLERRTKKRIELVSPQPKKNDKKKNDDEHNNSKKKPKEPPLTTVVLKMSLHCDGCCRRIRNIIRKTEGVHGVEINREKELVTIHGAVEPKAMQMKLKMKMKRSAEIVPAKKEKEKGNGEKMEQSNGGNQKNQQQQQKSQKMGCSNNNSYRGEEAMDAQMMMMMDQYGSYAPTVGYVVERLPAPQIFSDENPNACSVM